MKTDIVCKLNTFVQTNRPSIVFNDLHIVYKKKTIQQLKLLRFKSRLISKNNKFFL